MRNWEDVTIDNVNVVTCGTRGVISGTSALFHIQAIEPRLLNKVK